jgi:pSer/pThr/pTyr-binding forkhead associated (FHA) protein
MLGDRITIGRSTESSVVVANDEGLSRRHAAIQRDGDVLRLLDCQSVNGTYLNYQLVPPQGEIVNDGDEIFIGNRTVIKISVKPNSRLASVGPSWQSTRNLPLFFLAPLVFIAVVIAVVFVKSIVGGPINTNSEIPSSIPNSDDDNRRDADKREAPSEPTPIAKPTSDHDVDKRISEDDVDAPIGPRKLYKSLSDEQKKEFIKDRAGHIAIMMGKRPYAFTPDALDYIKFWLEAFASRVGNNRTGLWRGDTRYILERGRLHAPVIIHAFKQNRVPPVIGLYIPFIETEYTNIQSNNAAGAAGLFQFLGPTAEHYGVSSAERTDVTKMAPAAARYFRDNIMSFGDDSMSVALAIAGYNRAPESVKRDLRNVLNVENNEDKERNFWTLIANQGKLDHFFQNENKNYVPRFFAAAILGETPWAFGIEMRPLSTYTTVLTEPSEKD